MLTPQFRKKWWLLPVVVVLLVLWTVIGTGRDVAQQLAEIRVVAEQVTPALKTEKSTLMLALLLRNQVHSAALLTDDGFIGATNEEFSDWSRFYTASILEQTRGNRCNGKVILYLLALRAFGIQARMVALYGSDKADKGVLSHALVDVRIDGRWIALDPTYDVSFRDQKGGYLGLEAVVQRLRAHEAVLLDHDNKPTIGHLGQLAYEDYANFALLGPWQGGAARSLNPAWDGNIHYANGTVFDAWASINGDPYKIIAAQK